MIIRLKYTNILIHVQEHCDRSQELLTKRQECLPDTFTHFISLRLSLFWEADTMI